MGCGSHVGSFLPRAGWDVTKAITQRHVTHRDGGGERTCSKVRSFRVRTKFPSKDRLIECEVCGAPFLIWSIIIAVGVVVAAKVLIWIWGWL